MVAFWTSKTAFENSLFIPRAIDAAEKIVFSRTLKTATWANPRIMSEDIIGEIRKLKESVSSDLT
jgi:dihydrofolate reductase